MHLRIAMPLDERTERLRRSRLASEIIAQSKVGSTFMEVGLEQLMYQKLI